LINQTHPKTDIAGLRLIIRGAVQGVGFRPFIYKLANELGLSGWVMNTTSGVFIEAEGAIPILHELIRRIEQEKPPRSFIQSLEPLFHDPVGHKVFEIRQSSVSGSKTALILPDIATCQDCLKEIFDPANRRYLYPFTNCTHCGPRFSIIKALPYDRQNTTMSHFIMCDQCLSEYENPLDRRFHAQPNACPVCGPHLEFLNPEGRLLSKHHDALMQAAEAIRKGLIVAVKGLGGFHLVADSRNDKAVMGLRHRKAREEKPLAIMCPSLEQVQKYCEVSELEKRLLLSPEAPIVLLRKQSTVSTGSDLLSGAIAPGNPTLGVMLPYAPLHHLLLVELGFPIIATSGNRSEEPICIDEQEALLRLSGYADYFLVHNRPIARHVDDSITRIMMGREMVLRRARGYAPLPIHSKQSLPCVLATGAHLKNAIALAVDHEIFISQHIGDLETTQAYDAFTSVISDFEKLYSVQADSLACDMHPEYLSTKFANDSGHKTTHVQHHAAHIYSCMLDNDLDGPVLGVSWDGTGYGLDGTVWGGEFLFVSNSAEFHRVAHLRPFRLPGGEKAVKEPRRSAMGMLFEIFGSELFSMKHLAPIQAFNHMELKIIEVMLKKNVNSPVTSSAGRLFDAAASLIALRQVTKYEGQSAMELEFAVDEKYSDDQYEIAFLPSQPDEPLIIDWEPMIHAMLKDLENHVTTSQMSARFHRTLVEMIVAVARRFNEQHIVLSGGCFQNRVLTEWSVRRLRQEGFKPYWHQRIPPNDGGIAVGQIMAASGK